MDLWACMLTFDFLLSVMSEEPIHEAILGSPWKYGFLIQNPQQPLLITLLYFLGRCPDLKVKQIKIMKFVWLILLIILFHNKMSKWFCYILIHHLTRFFNRGDLNMLVLVYKESIVFCDMIIVWGNMGTTIFFMPCNEIKVCQNIFFQYTITFTDNRR